MMDRKDVEIEAHFKRLDAWLQGNAGGEIPLAVLRGRGIVIPDDDAALDDAALTAKLWEVITAMADLRLVLDFTDHLSDRELYRALVRDLLTQDEFLEEGTFTHLSVLGDCADPPEQEIWLKYYADDADRADWLQDFGDRLPPRMPRPYDRDRFLPGRM
jgi:hypothetical protein